MGADWLQGPYVYALYSDYGFNRSDIGVLFIGGFLSSMVFGTFVGSLADKYGRKLLCICFGIFYSISCLTKLINNFWVLLLGRILSGIATSLLFSSFESWMITEHKARGFSPDLLSETFDIATFGNGIVAIIAGLVASAVANYFGYVAPFMISLVLLIIGSIVVALSWNENYGDSTVDVSGTFFNTIASMKNDIKIPMLGLVQSLFEAAMYTFVFMWTPAMEVDKQVDGNGKTVELPFGLIFACFMVCIMIGSSLFGIMCKFQIPHEHIAKLLLIVATFSLLVPVFFTDMLTVFLGFLVFEVCCGLYFPCVGTLRGKYIPEHTRAATMNFFRVPLNFLVVIILIQVGNLSNKVVFGVCGLWMISAFLIQTRLRPTPKASTHE